MSETSASSFWWNSSVTSFLPVVHWDTLLSGISNTGCSPMSKDSSCPVGTSQPAQSCAPQIPPLVTVLLLSQNPAVPLLSSLHSHHSKTFFPSGCIPETRKKKLPDPLCPGP